MKFKTHQLDINRKYNNGIVVDRLSHDNPYDSNQVHRHNYYEILFFFNANGGEQKIDFKDYKIKSKTIYTIAPGQIHLLKRNPNENGISIQFSKEFLLLNFSAAHLEWMDLLQKYTELTLTNSKYDELFVLTQKLLLVFDSRDEFSFQKITNYFSLILIEILEFINQEYQDDVNQQNNTALQFISLVQKHFRKKRMVKEYALLMNISINKLTKEIGNSFGKSPKEIIQEHLLLEIKRLLAVNELSHKEISYLLNFDSQNSYNRFITNHTKHTPSELKKELAEIHK
ncbi:AraC-like DNA-binding protein [Aquimarina sp. MAR_2010_214]|uniref:helix-turn-helix domain-containing protein n=1 Tax=Aquimarina sp. MAR_2010_214 TaxID=1250026 RepID=UPI000C701842|nr:helix-turn-helix domain-containing protein [Aquimarina sp. MAR_2010_214]PKV50094.1 AraC-like DNA-binding protein [Aquimarina sp. MAR_2010_214]